MLPKRVRSTEDDGVVVGKLSHRRNRRLLVEFEPRFAGDLLGNQLGYPLYRDAGAGLPGALGDGSRHRFDMAVGGVVEHENLRHLSLPERVPMPTASFGNAEW